MPIDSVASLVDELRESRLLSPGQLEEIARELLPRYPDPRALAKELVQREWLTPYQVNQLFQGRGRQLVLGSYVLLERLGEGGMGQVFKARHEMMDRIVALKVIRKERLKHPDAVRRFHREIQAAAKLAHPNIVIAHDANQVGDTHFFAMEFVDGIDLARLAMKRGPLPIGEACDYIRQAAQGLQHAHERGLVHRDIKPANLLLTARGGVVKVLDMGLARLHQAPDDDPSGTLTQDGSVMGTPDYIAPEQAQESHTVDIRADIYSLGCSLYFLLTGRVPFPGGTMMHKLMRHARAEPPAAELLRPELPADLGQIIRKMMAKRPEERFQTPADVVAALEPFAHYASGSGPTAISPGALDPDQAWGRTAALAETPDAVRLEAGMGRTPEPTRPLTKATPAVPGRTRRWQAFGAVAVLLMFVGVVIYLRSRDQPQRPDSAPDQPGPAVVDQALPELERVLGEDLGRQWGPARCVAYNPRRKVIASGGEDRTVRLWDAETLRPLKALPGHAAPVTILTFSLDGRLLLSADESGANIWLWDLDSDREPRRFPGHGGRIAGMAFLPDGRRVVSAGFQDFILRVWDVDSGRELHSYAMGDNSGTDCLALAPDGKRAATGHVNGLIRIWTLETGKAEMVLKGHTNAVHGLAWHTTGKILMSGGEDKTVRVWDMDKGKGTETSRFEEQEGPVLGVAIAPDGGPVLTRCADRAAPLRLWHAKTKKELHRPTGHLGLVNAFAFSPDGREFVTDGEDGTIRRWSTQTGLPLLNPEGHVQRVACVALSPDGRQVLTGGMDMTVRLWDVQSGKERRCFRGHARTITGVAFMPDPRHYLSGDDDGVRLWEANSDQAVRTFTWRVPTAMALSTNGSRLACASSSTVSLADPQQGQLVGALGDHESSVSALAISGDGSRVLSGGTDCLAQLWAPGQPRRRFAEHTDTIRAVAFCPDSRHALSAGLDRAIWRWNLQGEAVQDPVVPAEFPEAVLHMAFSPDTRLLGCSTLDGRIVLWDTETGRKRSDCQLSGPAYALAFSNDGKRLVTANGNGTAFVLRLPND